VEFKTRELTLEDAKLIYDWEYTGEYSVYNLPSYELAEKLGFGLTIAEFRNKEFIAFENDDVFFAFGRIKIKEDKVYLGVGIDPGLCGKGYGKMLMLQLIKEAKIRYPDKKICLAVRVFNLRAKKCYMSVGFKVVEIVKIKTPSGEDSFYDMEYRVE